MSQLLGSTYYVWAMPKHVFLDLDRIPRRSSGFIHDFLDHYTLERQKAVSAYL